MIVLRFTSGLGNQMFQYSFYSYLKKRYPKAEVLADISWYEWNSAHQGFELEKLFKRDDNPDFIFEKAGHFKAWQASGTFPQTSEAVRYINRITRLFAGKHFERQRLSETGREDENVLKERIDNLDPAKNTYITGYFLKEDYYADNLSELRKAFSFDISNIGEDNRRLLDEIRTCNSVSVHVRRGDYLTSGKAQGFLSLDMDYYRKAVEFIKERVKDPVFYLFSDDADFLRKNFSWLENTRIVSGNDGDRSYIDMLLMSRCCHNITANSTFSEWAGLLNADKDALVIYPKAYIQDKDSDIKHINGWHRI